MKTNIRNEKLLELFKLLQMYPEAWHMNYRNRAAKNVALTEMAEALGTTREDIKLKIRSLRSQYTREIRRMKETGDMTPKWEFFHHVQFMYGHENTPNQANTDDVNDEHSSCDMKDLAPGNDCSATNSNPNDINNCDDKQTTQHETPTTESHCEISNIKCELMDEDNQFTSTNNAISENGMLSNVDDEYTNFAKNLANVFRRLEYDEDKLQLKCAVLEAVMKAHAAKHKRMQEQTNTN